MNYYLFQFAKFVPRAGKVAERKAGCSTGSDLIQNQNFGRKNDLI